MAETNTYYRICSTSDLFASRPEPFAPLVREWVELNEAPSTADAVARWARMEPALAGFSTVGEIPVFVDQASVEVKDEVLAALLRLAHGGQTLAGRTVLHCMLPGLRRLHASRPVFHRRCAQAGQRAGYDHADAEHFLISECWMQIMHYPLDRRPRKIASNLYWDTRKNAISQPARECDVFMSELDDYNFRSSEDVEEGYINSVTFENFSTDLSACIAWALSTGALTIDEARLLTDTCVEHGMKRPTVTDPAGRRNVIYLTIAQEQGLSYSAVVKQVSRAKARLVSAITDNLRAVDDEDISPIFCAS